MYSKILIATTLASAVSAQSSAASGSGSSSGTSGQGPNAISMNGDLSNLHAGSSGSVSWSLNGASPNGAVKIYAVAGPATDLVTLGLVGTAGTNSGTAAVSIPSSVPATIALAIVQSGEPVNYSPQFAIAGGAGAAPSGPASNSAAPTGSSSGTGTPEPTASGSSSPSMSNLNTAETLTATPSPSSSGNSTYSSSGPTQTESQASASSTTAAKPNNANALKFSSAALVGCLAAALFAL